MLNNILNFEIPELKFGTFTFEHLEHFGAMPWGGSQRLVVHELIGGERKVSAMGRSDMLITITGMFEGITARNRAQYINTLRVQAKEDTLTWENFSYQAIIQSFSCSDEGPKWPFTLTFLTIKDNTNPVTTAYPSFFDDEILAYMNFALAIGDIIQDPLILTPLNLLAGLIDGFPKQTGPTQSQAQAASQQTKVTQQAVSTAYTPVYNSFPGTNSDYATITANNELLTNLRQLNVVLEIIAKNLTLYLQPQDPNMIMCSNADLFRLAVQYYGDELLWTAIAEANNLYSPLVPGISQLIIPQNPGKSTGGVILQ